MKDFLLRQEVKGKWGATSREGYIANPTLLTVRWKTGGITTEKLSDLEFTDEKILKMLTFLEDLEKQKEKHLK